jgi:uncharacterized protein with von Willebrand factor type A (vWA) domain
MLGEMKREQVMDERHSVIQHDVYDKHACAETLHMYPKLRNTLQVAGETLPTAPALVEDVFYSLYKSYPTLREADELTPTATINRSIIDQMMSTAEWQSLRSAGTVGDQLCSAMATATVGKSMLNALGGEIIKRMQELHEAEGEATRLFDYASTLEDLAEQKPDKASKLYEQAKHARMQAEHQERQAQEIAQDLESHAERIEDATRQAARQAASQAEEEVSLTMEALKSFTGGYARGGVGAGVSNGTPGAMSLRERYALAMRVGESERLKQIAELCGRMSRIALQVQRTRIKHPPDEVVGITFGDDVAKMLPVETVFLSEPSLEDLFYKKYLEKTLMQLDMRGTEKQGRGPVVVAVDSSGSMASPLGTKASKEAWSKAVMLALLAIARLQKRDFAVLYFSHVGQMKQFVFPKGEAKPNDLLLATEFFYGGGTEYRTWMQTALKLCEESRFRKADVICVSDGDVFIPDELERDWNQRRKARQMRSYGVLLGDRSGEVALGRVCDAIATIDNLRQDTTALEMMFSI